MVFARIKNAFLEEYTENGKQQEISRQATEALIDSKDLIQSLLSIKKLYSRAHFDESAKFGFIRIAVTKIPPLENFDMYRGVSEFSFLERR